jgi:maltose alpha-D-glucosyltransferase/alpha-amylase
VEFVRTYLVGIKGQAYAPRTPASTRSLLEFFELEKAIYEVKYELNNRPALIGIPLTGLLRIVGHGTQPA